jgi:hypothetical protein
MLSIFILGTSDDSHGTTHRAAHHIPMSQIGTASWQGGYLSACAHMSIPDKAVPTTFLSVYIFFIYYLLTYFLHDYSAITMTITADLILSIFQKLALNTNESINQFVNHHFKFYCWPETKLISSDNAIINISDIAKSNLP